MRLGALVALGLIAATAGAEAADAPTWTLREIRVVPSLTQARVVREAHDAAGGSVEIEVSGEPYRLCPGGTERLRFSWRFDRSVQTVASGDALPAALDAVPVSATGGCQGGLAARSHLSYGGSNGQVNPFSSGDTATIDGGRFWPGDGGRVAADPAMGVPRAARASIQVDTRVPYKDRPRAWFSLDIATPGGSVKYVYLYAQAGAADARPTAPATGGPWQLTGVRTFPKLSQARVLHATHDAAGGTVDVEVSGDVYQLCPGGREVIRFTWRFDRPVTAVADGDPVTARLEATPLSATGGCTGGLAARSVLSFGGSNGQVNPYSADETAAIDGGRFWPSGGGRLFANPANAEGRRQTGTIHVDTRPVYADRKRAWFSVDIDTSGGAVKYAYEYERVR